MSWFVLGVLGTAMLACVGAAWLFTLAEDRVREARVALEAAVAERRRATELYEGTLVLAREAKVSSIAAKQHYKVRKAEAAEQLAARTRPRRLVVN